MFNSFMSMIGTPIAATPTTPAANVTIGTSSPSRSARKRHVTSNSTALELDGSSDNSQNISSPTVSPVKDSRENAMSSSSSFTSSSYVGSEENLSLDMKHNIDSVNLDDSFSQKAAIRYLLEKVRDHETFIINIAKENKGLKDEIAELYKQNDALAAENVVIQDLVASNKELKLELQTVKEAFSSEKDFLRYTIRKNAKDMKSDIKMGRECILKLGEDIDILDTDIREIQLKSCDNQIQVESLKDTTRDNFETLRHVQEELVRLEKSITTTNQYGRRENLIIDGIPGHVLQEDLENVCLDIIHSIGFLPVGNYEVVGCHRLKKTKKDRTAPTIIRFINRKVPEYCKLNKWRLKNLNYYDWNISFREDLCEANEAILARCEELKVQGHLRKVFTRNGFVKVAVDQEKTVKLSHMSDLSALFPGTLSS